MPCTRFPGSPTTSRTNRTCPAMTHGLRDTATTKLCKLMKWAGASFGSSSFPIHLSFTSSTRPDLGGEGRGGGEVAEGGGGGGVQGCCSEICLVPFFTLIADSLWTWTASSWWISWWLPFLATCGEGRIDICVYLSIYPLTTSSYISCCQICLPLWLNSCIFASITFLLHSWFADTANQITSNVKFHRIFIQHGAFGGKTATVSVRVRANAATPIFQA